MGNNREGKERRKIDGEKRVRRRRRRRKVGRKQRRGRRRVDGSEWR